MQLLKPLFMGNFDADTERKMGDKKKTFEWLVVQIPKRG